MSLLILQRHLQSQWNLENRFSGWVDVPLSKHIDSQAQELAKKISNYKIDVIYTSPLIRNQGTVVKIFENIDSLYPIFMHSKGKMKKWGEFTELNKNYIPVFVVEELNERYYGKLQGMDKQEIIKKYGDQKVKGWRRGVDPLPGGGETLKKVCSRVFPFYNKRLSNDLKQDKNVLIVASHNSLRALMKVLENISDKEIINVELPFGGMVIYELDNSLKVVSKKIL